MKKTVLATEAVVTKGDFSKPFGLLVHQNFVMDYRASFAARLVEKWGMVLAADDGEDSAGRAKMRIATGREVVERATHVADEFFKECEKLGWLVPTANAETAMKLAAERKMA